MPVEKQSKYSNSDEESEKQVPKKKKKRKTNNAQKEENKITVKEKSITNDNMEVELIGDKVIIPDEVIVKINEGNLAKDDASISLDDFNDIIDDSLGMQLLELPTLPDKDNALT